MLAFTEILEAEKALNGVVPVTPLELNQRLSDEIGAHVYLKREDLQLVRSYKIRGAFNKMSALTKTQKESGVVCASAGNHAQGVAFSCHKMQIHGTVFMPETTPKQKVEQVHMFGQQWINIRLVGDTFDAAFDAALVFEKETKACFVHPFDDPKVIAGQGTVGLEIIEQMRQKPDYILVPIGGGGLAAGLITALKALSPSTKIIGVEPEGAASMKAALEAGEVTTLTKLDKLVDGAAVKRVGKLNFEICQHALDAIFTVPEGKVCETILRLYNKEAMVVEPAGALTIAALEMNASFFAGKRVVCIVSGSNNDITRMAEIQERALLYRDLKHYFLIQFPQRPGALKTFVSHILGAKDDITYFQFSKKNNREIGPAVVGIEVEEFQQLKRLKDRLDSNGFQYEYLNDNPSLFNQLVG